MSKKSRRPIMSFKAFVYSVLAISLLAYFLAPNAASSTALEQRLMQEKAGSISMLTVPSSGGRAGGTGFQVRGASGKTYTMSNAHVCKGAENGYMRASVPGTGRVVLLRVLDMSDETDLCLLESLPYAKGESLANDRLEENDSVVVVGHPHLQPLTPSSGLALVRDVTELVADVEPSACVGPRMRVIRIATWIGLRDICLQAFSSMLTSAVIYPGNSGSPVFNSRGLVVGVVFAGDSRSNYGVIIPLEDVSAYLSVF